MIWRTLAVGVVLVLSLITLVTPAVSNPTKPVTIDGEVVRGGEARIDIVVEVPEDSLGGTQGPPAQLPPLRKRLTLLISAPGRIPLLDAQFPASAPVTRFTVEPGGDERVFTNCVVTGFKFEGPGRQRFLYSLRCEDVTP